MIKKLILKIAAWLRGESYLQAFIDKAVKDRLDRVFLGLQTYTAYHFANRKEFYLFLLMQGLDIMDRLYQKAKDENESSEDQIFIR